MTLLELITGPWAIVPAKLRELQEIYAVHLRGEKIDVDAVEARLGRTLANEQQEYRLEPGGVAVLAIEGVMAPKANLFMRISGGASTQMLVQQLSSMLADPRVRSVLLTVDSPGGSVLGVPALAEAVRELAAAKPTVAVSTGYMASAAYWVGSAANAVFIEGVTDHVGSIGVVATHSYEPRGPRIETEITAGRYKRIASPGKPLSAEGQAYLQQQVDHLYSVFVETIAQHRGVTPEQVLERMADGRVFIGQQAIDAGLVDGVATVDALVEQLATDPTRYARRRTAVFAPAATDSPLSEGAGAAHDDDSTTPKGHVMPQADTPITRESLERDHAALFTTLRQEFTAAGRQEGAAAELARVKAVLAEGEGLKGHQVLVMQLALDGKTTGAEAAQAILAADRQALKAAATAHHADAPNPAPSSPAPKETTAAATREQLAAKAEAYAKQHNVSFVDACKALDIQLA